MTRSVTLNIDTLDAMSTKPVAKSITHRGNDGSAIRSVSCTYGGLGLTSAKRLRKMGPVNQGRFRVVDVWHATTHIYGQHTESSDFS